jgi:pimeloyl-ACP methyl ester carboxylesterase
MTRFSWLLYGAVLIIACGCASPAVNPSFPVTFDSADAAIRDMEKNPQPLPRPLVVVGGYLDPDISPLWLNDFFGRVTRNATIVQVSLLTCSDFQEARANIIDAVDRACPGHAGDCTTDVDVVGMSMGGLAARYAAAPSRDPAHSRRLVIARLFTISSPHAGAVLAKAGITPLQRDMKPGSDFLKYVAKFDETAGYHIYPYVYLQDLVVGAQFAAPPGTNPYWLSKPDLATSHTSALFDIRFLADISLHLRGEPAFTNSPPVPLPGPSVGRDGRSSGLPDYLPNSVSTKNSFIADQERWSALAL